MKELDVKGETVQRCVVAVYIYSICYTVITASERTASHILEKPDNLTREKLVKLLVPGVLLSDIVGRTRVATWVRRMTYTDAVFCRKGIQLHDDETFTWQRQKREAARR